MSEQEGKGLVSLAGELRDSMQELRRRLGTVVVGQEAVIEQLIITLLSGGHGLLTGVPGLGKTLLVKSLAQLFSLSFKRIQFTPDLMPADVFGTELLQVNQEGQRVFQFVPGPLFANIVLADEINRTPPKTQAALLEAMGEGHVTSAGKTYDLQLPFLVLATQNPIESEGTYPLPEAQLDRFLMNVVLDFLPLEQEMAMVKATTGAAQEALQPILTGETILAYQRLVRLVPASDNVIDYAVRLCAATRPGSGHARCDVDELVRWGAGSRASQALILAGKARALLHGRLNVSCEDVAALALPVLRHRVILSYRGEAAGMTVEILLNKLLKAIEH